MAQRRPDGTILGGEFGHSSGQLLVRGWRRQGVRDEGPLPHLRKEIGQGLVLGWEAGLRGLRPFLRFLQERHTSQGEN